MNVFRQLFENVLFEFDWGQTEPENAINILTDFSYSPEDIKNQADIEPVIAKYVNWYALCQSMPPVEGVTALESPEVVQFRMQTLAAIHNKLVETDRDHPALLVFAHDCQTLQQDSICTPPNST